MLFANLGEALGSGRANNKIFWVFSLIEIWHLMNLSNHSAEKQVKNSKSSSRQIYETSSMRNIMKGFVESQFAAHLFRSNGPFKNRFFITTSEICKLRVKSISICWSEHMKYGSW